MLQPHSLPATNCTPFPDPVETTPSQPRISQQLFPLWLLKDPQEGGFNFDESAIGTVIAMTGPVQLLSQVFAVPALARMVSYRKGLRFGLPRDKPQNGVRIVLRMAAMWHSAGNNEGDNVR